MSGVWLIILPFRRSVRTRLRSSVSSNMWLAAAQNCGSIHLAPAAILEGPRGPRFATGRYQGICIGQGSGPGGSSGESGRASLRGWPAVCSSAGCRPGVSVAPECVCATLFLYSVAPPSTILILRILMALCFMPIVFRANDVCKA